MALEQARIQLVPKPWGSTELRPWSKAGDGRAAIGELWFQRRDPEAPEPALLLKLLFTQQALSVQVHPDDAFAQAMGLAHGKTEAWYILSATPDATVGVGLTSVLTTAQLRAAIADGSIADLVQWRKALTGDVISVPAGTIHAIGAGLVLAEIQQRSDATFRLFDHGRDRELHIENGVASAHARPSEQQAAPLRISEVRTMLVATPYFVLERLDLAAGQTWELDAGRETWLVVIDGDVRLGPDQASIGEGCFVEDQVLRIETGHDRATCLVAYAAAEPSRDLLRCAKGSDARAAGNPIGQPPAPPPVLADSATSAMKVRS